MAFQNLRTGSTVYIFHKDNSPKLEIGQVIAEPKIRQKYPIPTPGQPYAGFMPQQQEQVVDLSIKIGDKVQPIEGLTPSTDIWEFFNSFAHEVDHIEKHIAKTLNFSPYSESASYLVGEIIRNMFYNITRKMLC